MRDSWKAYLQRMAIVCIVGSTTAWTSAVCYAVTLASDVATHAAYQNDDANAANDGDPTNNTNGWKAGDNGGFGFGAWSFVGTYSNPATVPPNLQGMQQEVDDGLKTGVQGSSQFNDVGRAWTMFNPDGRNVGTTNGPTAGTDIARAGRSIPPLQVGNTLTVVLDNPTQRFFYRGYNVKLNTGGGNICDPSICPSGPQVLAGVGTFEYFDYGSWDGTTLFDTDTDAGVRIEFTLSSATTYDLKMTPLDNPGLAFTETAIPLNGAGTIDWIEFQFYNTDSDFYPSQIATPQQTDYYIRSIEITGAAPPGVPGDYNDNGAVDAADYVMWRQGGPLQNEVSEPGEVSMADYTAWRTRFGNTSGVGSGLGNSSVPEPGAFMLIVCAAGLVSLLFARTRCN
jgi:hypothetical protein